MRASLLLACLPLFAGELGQHSEADTTEAAKIALRSLVAQQQEVQRQANLIVAEECGAKFPEAKQGECVISPDFLKVIWQKKAEAPPPAK